MRLAVVNLTRGGLSGGYAKYLREMLPRLAQDTRIEAMQVVLPCALDLDVASSARIDVSTSGRQIRKLLAAFRPDVIFAPTYRWPGGVRAPVVTMIHNMEAVAQPWGRNGLLVGLKNLARRFSARSACRRAHHVVAVSGFVHDWLVENWGLRKSRVSVVPHGVNPPASGPGTATGTTPGLRGRETPDKFLLTVGSIRPYRALEDVLHAMALLNRADAGLKLIVAGSVDPDTRRYGKSLLRLTAALGIEDAVIWAGQVSPGALDELYRKCACFVMTSRVEACPNTALEALSHGCRIVSTRSRPMPEFFEKVAQYYDPGDFAALAAAAAGMLDLDASQQARLATAARARAADFTWETTAKRTIDVLMAVATRGRRA